MYRFFLVLCPLLWLVGCDTSHDTQNSVVGNKPIDIEVAVESTQELKQIILTLGSWRKDDVEQISYVLNEFNKQYPHIVIKFDPTEPAQYNDVLAAQLEGGTAPDLYYLRSHSASAKHYDQGYLVDLNELTDIEKNFPDQMTQAWTSRSGDIYGVPLMAVSHGIYYNASFFAQHKLSIPNSWEELLLVADKIKEIGVTPFANATGDSWMVNGLIFQNLIPGFIGGEVARLEYYNGTRCYNDSDMVDSFEALANLSNYISENHNLLNYADTLQLFLQGRSPMLFGGSWDIPFFESQNPAFDWKVFAIPPPEGKEHVVTFHPDAAIGLNSASPYKEEAKLFLQWMTTKNFADLYENQLPGFFPMHNSVESTDNIHANMFLDLHQKYRTDTRIWRQIEQGSPSDYELAVSLSNQVMSKAITPEVAANWLHEGIAKWHAPAEHCGND